MKLLWFMDATSNIIIWLAIQLRVMHAMYAIIQFLTDWTFPAEPNN